MNSECPQCRAIIEYKERIILCPNKEAQETWNNALTSLQQWLRDYNMDYFIISGIIEGLQQWHDRSSESVNILGQVQTNMGWR